MNELQKKILNLIKWFHNFCEDNKLTYYMLGGTMLGAIRHSGFIPWDDDADFGMPREDYEKFIKLTTCNIYENNIVVESYHNGNKDFPYYFVKIYDLNTTLIERSKNNIIRGIYIDVFPLDGLGSHCPNSFLVKRNFLMINFFNAKRFAVTKKRNFKKNLLTIIAKIIPPFFLSNSYIAKKLNKRVSVFDFKESKYIANYFGAWQYKEIIQKEILGNPSKYRFESIDLYGPEHFDNYLKCLYGEYMELPPEDKRGNHHSFSYINLKEPYLNIKLMEKNK